MIDVDDVIAVASAWTAYHISGAYTAAAGVNCHSNAPCDGANNILDVGAVA
jgi:hypothetical protein